VPPTPAVSIVIPLYNKRATIARSLESVLAQTFGDFEVIVVDDGSSDGGADLVTQTYPDPRIRLHQQENAGPGAARNAGARLARGDLITFLDADDAWRPELLATATRVLGAHPECGAFTSAFDIEPQGIDRWEELRAEGFTEGVWRLTARTPRSELPNCLNAFHSCTAVYRRDVVARYGGFFEERCTFGEDVYFWVQVLTNHAIYRHLQPLAEYHTEDSELGIGARTGRFPLEPVLTAPGPIRASCPPAVAENLELWLGKHAADAAFMQLDRGDRQSAIWLLKAFPSIKEWRSDYFRLRLRILSPTLYSVVRRLAKGG
jgi:glycosyltransferase involved in cell wall biosynthesis